MFSFFESNRLGRGGLVSRLSRRAFKIMCGLLIVYLGVNLAGALVKNDSNVAKPMRDVVYKYDALSILTNLSSKVLGAIEKNLANNPPPESVDGVPADLTQRAKDVSGDLEGDLRNQIPALHNAFEEAMGAAIKPVRESIKEQSQKK